MKKWIGVCVLGFGMTVAAETIRIQNDGDWASTNTWTGGVMPGVADIARINRSGKTATVTTVQSAGAIQVGVDESGTLVVDGGVLTAGNASWCGIGGGSTVTGSLIVVSGAVMVSNNWQMATGTGAHHISLTLHGGQMVVNGAFLQNKTTAASAVTTIYGGTLRVNSLQLTVGTMNLVGGELIISGDQTSYVNSCVSAGRLVADGGFGAITAIYRPETNDTLVTAGPAATVMLGMSPFGILLLFLRPGRRMMKKPVAAAVVFSLAQCFAEESSTNAAIKTIDVRGGFIYNHGAINPGDLGLAFTNAGVRDVTVSAGQLSGIDPETGAAITNSANLLSLKAESVTTVSNITAGGTFVGDGSGLTDLKATAVSGVLPASALPVSGTWNASGVTIENASLSGTVHVAGDSLTVSTNLTVQGVISGDGSGLSRVAAGGADGTIQFNQSGQLAGNTNYFIHPESGKLAFTANRGNLFRVFRRTGDFSETNMTYVLRCYKDTTELCMFQNGEETIRIRGDGSIYAAGTLNVSGLSLGGGESSVGSVNWFIPEEGDLSMGTFTQQ